MKGFRNRNKNGRLLQATMGDPSWKMHKHQYSPFNAYQKQPFGPTNPLRFPINNPIGVSNDATPEEALFHDIQNLFDSKQISEDLYNKLVQALLEELDK